MTLLRLTRHSSKTSPTLYALLIFLVGLWSLVYCSIQTLRKHMRHLLARRVMLAFLIVTGHFWTNSALAIERLRVGVYNYSPLVFVDEQKQAKGLFVDVLDFIARQENWTLEYLPGTWPENLARLENGEIDLLVNIAHTEERAKKFDFTQQHLFLDWGMVYRRQGAKIDTIFDLKNKRVAVLKGSLYAGELKKLLDQFAIKVEFVEKSEFSAVFKAIESGEVDAGANASLAGLKLPESSPIQSTSIAYAPTKLQFAVRKDSNQALLAKLDQHVAALHADKNSAYHESHQKWFGQIHQKTAIPAWVWWMIGSLIIGLSLLIGLSIFLDRLVRRKTSDLRASEENLAITLHSIGDGVIATDAAGRVTRMNVTAERLSGWTLMEAAGRPMVEVFRIVNADTRETVADPVQRVMTSGKVVGLANHTVLQAKDGKEYQIADSAAPICNADGTIVGVVLVFSDVTEKYQAEQTLQLTRFSVEAASDALFWITPEARIVDVNAAACSALGYSRKELLQLTVADVDSHYTAELWPQHFAELRQRGSMTFESEQRTKDGRLFAVEIVANHVKHGNQEYNCAFVRDITERKQAESALAEQKTIIELIIEQSLAGYWDWWIQKNEEYLSPTFKKMFGYEDHEMPNTPEAWQKIILPEDLPGVLEVFDNHVQSHGKIPFYNEVRYRHKDGSTVWVICTGRVIEWDEQGQPVRMIGCHIDVTRNKNAEAEIRQLNASLEERVRQRTADLEITNQLLIQAKLQAEAATIAKSAFLANMSHEIRTPMNGIIGMANVMRREGVTPQQEKRLDVIDASAQHLLSVINDVLDISKIEAGKFTLDEARVVTSSLMANVNSILAERAKAKGIRLLIETEHLPYNLVGDPTRLQQALLNYATNAVKFTEHGSVTLRALKQEETAETVVLRFEVVDTGIGIEPEAMSRLFSTFEQADNSMTRKYGGTGLGLAITRRLAELMGGEAGAKSTHGVGSTFWFTVKLRKGNEAVVSPEAVVDAEAEIRQHYAGHRILVVDDEPINREVALIHLEAADLVADTAEDGAEAVALARKNSYAAIFMDMQMPNLNGVDATQEIRQIQGYRDTPIIAMTANAFAEDKATCLAAGMSDFLIKPFNPDKLFAVLLRALSRGEG